jgi:hypothetical protein
MPGTPDIYKEELEPLFYIPSIKKSVITYFSYSLHGIESGKEYSYNFSNDFKKENT